MSQEDDQMGDANNWSEMHVLLYGSTFIGDPSNGVEVGDMDPEFYRNNKVTQKRFHQPTLTDFQDNRAAWSTYRP